MPVPTVRPALPGAIRINVSISTALLDQLDRAVRAAGDTRSGFIADMLRKELPPAVQSPQPAACGVDASPARTNPAGL